MSSVKKKIHFMLKQPCDFMLFFSSMNYVNLAFIFLQKEGVSQYPCGIPWL